MASKKTSSSNIVPCAFLSLRKVAQQNKDISMQSSGQNYVDTKLRHEVNTNIKYSLSFQDVKM
ncbi:708_t:CDS:2 [Gigaspora rosea]|nr:708_t:CDS:2 [Gigaspora rosea]